MVVLNFRQKMYWLCVLGVLSALVVGCVGYFAQLRGEAAIAQSVVNSAALRNHLEADMMHDAIRGDVLAALLSASEGHGDGQEAVLQDFREHADWFRRSVEANRQLPLSRDIEQGLQEIGPALDAYIRDAGELIEIAARDLPAAKAKQAAFMASFSQLEARMETASDLISAGTQQSQTKLQEDLSFYEWLTVGILLLASCVLLAVGSRIINRILQQLGGDPDYAKDIVQQVANGTLNVSIRLQADSHGSLLHAIEDMRQKLQRNFEEMERIGAETRRLAEESLRVRQALDVCATAAFIASPAGEVVYINQAGQRLFSATRGSFVQAGIALPVQSLSGWNIQPLLQVLNRSLQQLHESCKQRVIIADRTFDVVMTPVMGADRSLTGVVQEWVDLTEELGRQARERAVAQENARVRQALDNVTANTMIADSSGNIVYMNSAVLGMLKAAESDIRKALPQFDTGRLLGANFDVFHQNPAHQRSLLAGLTGAYRSQISVGGRTFTLVANPILNEQRERIGTVVEWADRTQEVLIENELAQLLGAANDGDLSRRIPLEGKQGFFLTLSQGLNELLALADDVISNVIRVMDALAHGRLTEKVEREYRGMFDKLKQDTNATVGILVNVVEKIAESAQSVAAGAQEIAQANEDLSQRTEEQASSLEETASSMEEMNSAVRESSDNAASANQLATDAYSRACSGGEVVTRAVSAMSAISASSKKIADIIAVIDEIAFQTNLLALNAAVEAARAGEQGRGFAVVAGEVRNLAQRSASAAKEIKDLIRDSVGKVEDGTSLVNESGATFSELVESVRGVSRIVQEIASAAKEQASGITQVNTAISQMDQMTQQNAALVEEVSAAGETLTEQARHLLELIAFFDLGKTAASRQSGTVRAVGRAPAPRPAVSPSAPSAARPVDDEEWQEF